MLEFYRSSFVVSSPTDRDWETKKGTRMTRRVETGGGVGSGSLDDIVTLADGDTLEVWVQNETSTSSVTFEDINFCVNRAG